MDSEAMQAETMENTAAAEVTTDAALDAFDADWDSDGLTAAEEDGFEMADAAEETAEADQQTAGDAENATEAETPDTETETEPTEERQSKAEDQRFVLKHLDETRILDLTKPEQREEASTLMQKGMDYDRKTGLLTARIDDYEEFFKDLMPEGLTIEQFMDITRARMYKSAEAKEGREISESNALLKIQKDRAEKKAAAKAAAKREAETKEAETNRKSAESIQRFVAEYPGVKADDIPQTVWEEAKKDGDLLGAYTRFELKKLKAENEALKQNEKNKARSTGSRKTEGAAAAKDPFDAAWDAF